MAKTRIQKNIKNFVPTLQRDSCAEVNFFFTTRWAEVTESIDTKTTAIASVAYPLLISATFWAELNQRAAVTSHNKKTVKSLVMCHRHVSYGTKCAAINFVIVTPLNYVE